MKPSSQRTTTQGLGSLLAAAVLLTLPANAAVLVADNFTGSSGSNVGTVNNTESTGVGTYSTVNGSLGMTVTTLSGFGSGNVLSLANNANTYYRAFDGAQTLTLNSLSVGQTLRFSFDARFVGGFSGADNFSFGFVNFSSPNSVLYVNADLSAAGGTISEFRYRTGSFNMSDNIASSIIGGYSYTEPATLNAVNYNMQMNVTKQSGGGFRIDYYREGVLAGSTTQAGGSAFVISEGNATISGIAIRHSNTPNITTYLDNVNVTLVVPEPMTATLVLGGVATLLALRRRRCAA